MKVAIRRIDFQCIHWRRDCCPQESFFSFRMSSAQVLSRGHKGLLTASQKIRKSCRESGAYGWEESVAD